MRSVPICHIIANCMVDIKNKTICDSMAENNNLPPILSSNRGQVLVNFQLNNS
jgi:hypothetical protein